MVKEGDSWKDLVLYLKFRKQHLLLERQKIPFVIKEKDRATAHKTLTNRIKEINQTMRVIAGNIKESSKYEFSKVKYLNDFKIKMLKK